jgi:hypothetical protein
MKTIRTKLILGVLVALGTASVAFAQGDIPSGTISGSGSGPYNYSLTFSDGASATSPIGSVWYAWIPGFFYLPGMPTGASAPAGWTANVSGDSVQYTANSSANYIQPGQSLSGFGYTAAFSPAQLAAAPNSGDSDAYTAGLFSDAGVIFTVQAVPEPSAMSFLGAGVLVLVSAGRRKLRI